MSKHFLTSSLIIATLSLIGITLASQENKPITHASISSYPVDSTIDLRQTVVRNPTAYITSQCYTKTEDDKGGVFNPCYACHVRTGVPNYLDDSDLQLSYAFPSDALINPWTNLFEDRSLEVSAIEDQDILRYFRTDNYFSENGEIILAAILGSNLPPNWDLDGDGHWNGYIPDAYFEFDNEGFDRRPDGTFTGWRAFGYTPFLGTFWPTNGSTDDVLIRLPDSFRTDRQGNFDLDVYKLNLAIVEAMIKRQDVRIGTVQEDRFGVDLDKNGSLGIAEKITYDWAPLEQRFMRYVGSAGQLQEQSRVHLAAGLFPEGTEFLHSVRYLDVGKNRCTIGLAARMKELRYARKKSWYTYSELKGIAEREGGERALDPDLLKSVPGDFERGMFTQGWVYQGFIEDRTGNLRPQSQEETLFCMGCHGGIGATTDTIFSFPRKFSSEAFQQGWYHWTQKGIVGTLEPLLPDGEFEYTRYLGTNGAGDEFRANTEVRQSFFDSDGLLIDKKLDTLHGDISQLLLPSAERALLLNKAYKVIVERQSFVKGRDATIKPPANVHRSVMQDQSTGVDRPLKSGIPASNTGYP